MYGVEGLFFVVVNFKHICLLFIQSEIIDMLFIGEHLNL